MAPAQSTHSMTLSFSFITFNCEEKTSRMLGSGLKIKKHIQWEGDVLYQLVLQEYKS